MKYNNYGNYDLNPKIRLKQPDIALTIGYKDILETLKEKLGYKSNILICDLYPGVDEIEVLNELKLLNPSLLINTKDLLFDCDTLDDIFKDNITDDRVFGYMSQKTVKDCFDPDLVEAARSQIIEIKNDNNLIIIFGVGASYVYEEGLLVYFDMPRWEIELRYRQGQSNWLANNHNDAILSKFKRGYFIEWRIADRHKIKYFDKIEYLVDTTLKDFPKMVSGNNFRMALNEIVNRPFRMKPYFDPGVWGGQWMKNTFQLDPCKDNYAWSFDGIPEENSINIQFKNDYIEIPTMDLVLYRPVELLGDRVHARFGREFPIRFDLLDTMEGGNLSLQVHPLTEYIQEKFGMHYTQDESYYILDASKDACVYLGVKENIDPKEMEKELISAEKGEISFDANKYINKIPVKKHDHVLIPAGTIHCSGRNTMVLEISATPYIFTFKLWDWDRVGLDGIPRPIHLEHGLNNIQWDRNTSWVYTNIVNQGKILSETSSTKIERTGLHSREFIDTLRVTTENEHIVKMEDSVHVLNLVEGKAALIVSIGNSFEPFEVHYAETFIIPANVKEYIIKPIVGKISLIIASVRK